MNYFLLNVFHSSSLGPRANLTNSHTPDNFQGQADASHLSAHARTLARCPAPADKEPDPVLKWKASLQLLFFFCFTLCFVVVETEPRALCRVGKLSG